VGEMARILVKAVEMGEKIAAFFLSISASQRKKIHWKMLKIVKKFKQGKIFVRFLI